MTGTHYVVVLDIVLGPRVRYESMHVRASSADRAKLVAVRKWITEHPTARALHDISIVRVRRVGP